MPHLARFEGRGVYYAATAVEAGLCGSDEVAVVGGGNSAGQAAVYLSERARRVHVLVRGKALADTMSSYLVARLESSDTIELHTETTVAALEGDDALRAQVWRHADGTTETREIPYLFAMIGADLNTGWVRGCLALDERGFVLTGEETRDAEGCAWQRTRSPFFLETSRPRVFAAGDVRAGSVKRVASAVGEGSMCVHFIHKVLHETL